MDNTRGKNSGEKSRAGKPGKNAPKVARRRKGFEPAGRLIRSQIKQFGKTRGFSETLLLTRWQDIVGPEIATMAQPIKITRGAGLGANLKLLTTGAFAPMLSLQTETIRARVNQFYGYKAISRITLSQTAPAGFSEGKTPFEGAKSKIPTPLDRPPRKKTIHATDGVKDEDLRMALQSLEENVLNGQSDKQNT